MKTVKQITAPQGDSNFWGPALLQDEEGQHYLADGAGFIHYSFLFEEPDMRLWKNPEPITPEQAQAVLAAFRKDEELWSPFDHMTATLSLIRQWAGLE